MRIGHWTLAIAFFAAYLTGEEILSLHVWSGYAVGAVVLVRVAWGIVGPRHARFASFVKSPRETFSFLRAHLAGRAERHLGHNPAGGAMVAALLLALTSTVASGLVLYALEEQAGPLAGWVGSTSPGPNAGGRTDAEPVSAGSAWDRDEEDDDERDHDEEDADRHHGGHDDDEAEEFWEEIHEAFANLTLLLVALHVAGVLFSSVAHRENLVRSMFTGRKREEV